MELYNDQEILELCKDESTRQKAFSILVKLYQKRLYWLIRKMVVDHDDADDVLQNVYIKAWRSIGDFQGNCAIFSWLYRICINESITFLKNKKRNLALTQAAFHHFLQNKLEENMGTDALEIEERLQQAILTLPEKQRAVFHLRYYDEMPYEEMSEVFNTSTGALKASYHIAMKKIEKILLGH
jgi:RNA polymerase sigma factor (sigma-70 family)